MKTTANYFTDASISNLNYAYGGTYGFIRLDDDGYVVDEFYAHSIPAINYLECKAIYDCLLRIQEIAQPGIEYIISSDSRNSISLINKYLYNQTLYDESSLFYQQINATATLLLSMRRRNIDVKLVKVKAHCNNLESFAEQIYYPNNSNPNPSQKELELMYCGNTIVDSNVNLMGNCRNLYSDIPCDQPIYITPNGMFTAQELYWSEQFE